MKKTIWTTAIILGLIANSQTPSLFARGGFGNASNNGSKPNNNSRPNNSVPRNNNSGSTNNQFRKIQNNVHHATSHAPTTIKTTPHVHVNSGFHGSPQIGHHPAIVNHIPQGFTGNKPPKVNTNTHVAHTPIHNHVPNHLTNHLPNGNHLPHPNHVNLNTAKLNHINKTNLAHLNNVHPNHPVLHSKDHLHNHVGLNYLARVQNKRIGGKGFVPAYISGHHIGHVSHPNNHLVSNKLNFGHSHINLCKPNYHPSYFNHSHCYHGYWNLYGKNSWHNCYHHLPYFWGLGGWGLGALAYNCGYVNYVNPYCGLTQTTTVYDYSQPIPVAYNDNVVVENSNDVVATDQTLNSAIDAFKLNNYDQALSIVNAGITANPSDAVLHEFRALVLFAKGDYQQAAATVHSILAVGPGWNWTTLSGMYADINLYTMQLRALEAAAKANPNDAALAFLLGYEYLSEGYPDSAGPQFQRVVALMPNDEVAVNLAQMLSPQDGQNDPNGANELNVVQTQTDPQDGLNLPSPDDTAADDIDPNSIVGNWHFARGDGSNFGLNLTGDSKFTWTYTGKGQPPQSFQGDYTLEGNTLALERAGGGSMVAQITNSNGSSFNFKMVGAPPEDAGLTFTR